jgi:hypothetical protein
VDELTTEKGLGEPLFLLSPYELSKVLISLAKIIIFYCKFSRFRTFYKKNELRAKKFFRSSRGLAVGFWTKFEAQLAQPCYLLES